MKRTDRTYATAVGVMLAILGFCFAPCSMLLADLEPGPTTREVEVPAVESEPVLTAISQLLTQCDVAATDLRAFSCEQRLYNCIVTGRAAPAQVDKLVTALDLRETRLPPTTAPAPHTGRSYSFERFYGIPRQVARRALGRESAALSGQRGTQRYHNRDPEVGAWAVYLKDGRKLSFLDVYYDPASEEIVFCFVCDRIPAPPPVVSR